MAPRDCVRFLRCNGVRRISFCLALLPVVAARGDMGSIPFESGAVIREPRQDAILVWGGKEQIIYLKTTLKASVATRVVEVMPLPSRPEVDACDPGVFRRLAYWLPKRVEPMAAGGEGPFAAAAAMGRPAGEVVETKRIGSHDLATVHVVDKDHFLAWLQETFGKDRQLEVSPKMLRIVESYLRDDFRWFLFDRLDLTPDLAEKHPLRIRFATDRLYYPLRISRTEDGITECNLSVVTNRLFAAGDCIGLPRDRFEVFARPVSVPGRHIRGVDEWMWVVLGKPEEVKVRTWVIRAEADSLQQDILIKPGTPVGKP